MGEYWGARVIPSYGNPYAETYYVMPIWDNTPLVSPDAGSASAERIEVLYQKVMNQHPEDISVLADQWVNAYNLLATVKQQLLDESTRLYEDYWRSSAARDEFMRRGPGETLAYLDEWMEAAANNAGALRAMVGFAQSSRAEMQRLWDDYNAAVNDAKNVDVGDWFGAVDRKSFWFGEWNGMDGARDEAAAEVQSVQDNYNRQAQDLVHRVGRTYQTYFGTVGGGHGPVWREMNVVLNLPGHDPFPSPPSLPPMPGAVPPPLGLQTPPPLPTTLPGVPPPEAPPAGQVRPPGPMPLPAPVPVVAPGLPGAPIRGPLGPSSGYAPPPGLRAGAPALPPSAAGRPGDLSGKVLRGAGNPAPPAGRGAGGTPARPGKKATPPGVRGTAGSDVQEAFARPPGSTAPPVLKPPPRAKHGGSAPAPPRHDPGEASSWRPSAAPPVLNAPGSRSVEPARREGEGDTDHPATSANEWLPDPVVAAPSVLDAPKRGAAPARLTEVPAGLQGRPRTAPGTAPSELAPRRTRPVEAIAVTPDEGVRVVTDREAFEVETPGGGVLAKPPEDHSYRPEPPTAISGSAGVAP